MLLSLIRGSQRYRVSKPNIGRQYLASVFPDPPLTVLIRAKVPPKPRPYPERKIKEMLKCGKQCTAYVQEGQTVKFSETGKWVLNRKLTCENKNTIHIIECQKTYCKDNRYLGETGRPLKIDWPSTEFMSQAYPQGSILTPQAMACPILK